MFKNSAKKEPNGAKETYNTAMVRQDPRMKVRTASAHSETTNTTERSATIFDNEKSKMTHQTVRQTVTNQKTARITEISIRRTPTKEELAELLMTSGPFPNFATPPKHWTKQETTVTQTNGRTQTSFVQQQKPTFQQPTSTTKESGTSWKGFTSSKPPSTVNVHADSYNPQSILRALPPLTNPTPTTTYSPLKKPIHSATTPSISPLLNSYSRIQSGSGRELTPSTKLGTSSSHNSIASKRAAFFNAKPTTTITPLSNTATGYVSPYANRRYRSQDAIGYSSSAKPTTTTTTTSTYLSPVLIDPKPLTAKSSPQNIISTLPSKPPIQIPSQPQKPLTVSAVKGKSNLKPGYVLIFNTVDFQDKLRFDKRDGSDYDAKLIKETLEKYKLNVNTKKNPTVSNIKDTIKKLTTKNFSNYSCLIIVILSHGSANDSIAATDGVYNMNEIILYPILDIPTLKEKPKIFIIQACKGAMEPGEYKTDAYTTRGPPTEILKCYSTFEGYVSYRGESGSPFIQALCNEIKIKGDNTNIEQLMKNAIETVKTKTGSKQVPCMTTNLTKPFVFGHYA